MIISNIKRVQERIATVCSRIGVNPGTIVLVAVTKTVPVETVFEAIQSGLVNHIGENRVQESGKKYGNLKEMLLKNNMRLHMIGNLQANKVKKAVQLFDTIQSVSGVELAEKINETAKTLNKAQDCFIELKVSEEATKSGLELAELDKFIENIPKFTNIKFSGIMAMAPFYENPELTRPYFKSVKQVYDTIKDKYHFPNLNLNYLSMGMSNDFEFAIEQGSNMVRIGSLIFK